MKYNFDKKSFNRLRTDLIHVQHDLMTPEDRTKKIAHIVDYVNKVAGLNIDSVNQDDALSRLNVVFGLQEDEPLHLTRKESSRIINDLITIKYENMSPTVKRKALQKISSFLAKFAEPAVAGGFRGPQVKPQTINPPPPPKESPKQQRLDSQIISLLRKRQLPTPEMLSKMESVPGNKIEVEIEVGGDLKKVKLDKSVVHDYIGEILKDNKSEIDKLLSSNRSLVKILGDRGLQEQLHYAFSSDPIKFLPKLENLMISRTLGQAQAYGILSFMFEDELNEFRSALFLMKRVSRIEGTKGPLAVLLNICREKFKSRDEQAALNKAFGKRKVVEQEDSSDLAEDDATADVKDNKETEIKVEVAKSDTLEGKKVLNKIESLIANGTRGITDAQQFISYADNDLKLPKIDIIKSMISGMKKLRAANPNNPEILSLLESQAKKIVPVYQSLQKR